MDVGPCATWEVECACCDLSGVSPAVTGLAAAAATEVLWARSGRQFGECPVTLMPCREECGEERYGTQVWYGASWPSPALVGGLWYNLGCVGGCHGDCSCNRLEQFSLPGPVSRVVEIVIDGSVVPSGSYRLDNRRFVVRTDGGSWPFCNDGSWLVTVMYGAEVPALGLLAVAELTCELVKACTPGAECGLPANVASVVRQGTAQEFRDVQELLKNGLIGLPMSDEFIRTFNPSGLASRPRMFSPDRRVRYPS